MIPKLRIMRRQAAHPRCRHPRWAGALGLAAALLTIGALGPATAAATNGPPVIDSTGWGVGSEITVEAKINPNGLATSYEIKLACETCGPPGYAPATGQLLAVEEARTVRLSLTGIKPGGYRFDVYASNTIGEASAYGELTVPEVPPGACLNGCSNNKENTAETPPWYEELSNSELAQTLEEYEEKQAREQQEQKTEQAARHAGEETELTQAEERQALEAAERERQEREENEAEHPACRVPALKGDTLTVARRALRRAHCRLGTVHRPARDQGTLYVSAQGTPVGKRLAHNARVTLWIRAKPASHGRSRGG